MISNQFVREQNKVDPEVKQQWEGEQMYLRKLISEKDDFSWCIDPTKPNCLQYVGGMDISFLQSDQDLACSFFVVLSYPELKVVYQDHEIVKLDMDYISGFLAFREAAHLIQLYQKLLKTKPEFKPDAIMIDGNGILHSNQCGLASHLGVLLDVPTIGCGKSTFYIDGLTETQIMDLYQDKVKNAGEYVKLVGDSGRCWGTALRCTSNSKQPRIISIGHKISIQTASDLVFRCCLHKNPEPIRQADLLSRDIMRNYDTSVTQQLPITNQLKFLSISDEKQEQDQIDEKKSDSVQENENQVVIQKIEEKKE